MNTKYLFKYTCLIILIQLVSCKKYLETKPDLALAVPSTIEDLQAILDADFIFRATDALNTSTDEYYLLYEDWQTLSPESAQMYAWHPAANDENDWSTQYNAVFNANITLEYLEKIAAAPGRQQDWNNVKGSALFIRAYCFFALSQIYAPDYNQSTASTDLGIVLRLSSDFNQVSVRSTVQESYDKIIFDLEAALELLPEAPKFKNRPGKAAAYAMLARVYLQMGKYELAKKNAEDCLELNAELMDFTQLDSTAAAPIPLLNNEVIFYNYTDYPVNIFDWIAKVDTVLYNSFDEHDLRKAIFFRKNDDGSNAFKGSYNGDIYSLFNGIAVDEVYLILAETEARAGNKDKALEYLNTLLQNRWDPAYFIPVEAVDADEALSLVIQERRKELMNRGLRWPDLRRLNKEPQFAVTLTRFAGANTVTLPPNDKRYTLLIPEKVMAITDLQQNPR